MKLWLRSWFAKFFDSTPKVTATPLLFVIFYMAIAPSFASQQNLMPTQHVILEGLDKVTARVFTIKAKVGQEVSFGNLRILVRECRVSPPEEAPETLSFLEIDEIKPGEARKRVFSGWMFASNPALHGMEHPVYDVWVKEGVRDTPELQGLQQIEGEDKTKPKECPLPGAPATPEELVDCPEPPPSDLNPSEDQISSILERLKGKASS